MFRPANRAMPEGRCEFGLSEALQLSQIRGEGNGRGLEGGLVGGDGIHIVWTGVQTIVAAEDPIADPVLQVVRYRAGIPKLDGEIRDASSRIDHIGFCDGLRRAGPNTQGAAAAKIGSRVVRLQIQRRQNFAEQQPGTELRRDEVGMFADPSKTTSFSPGFLHHRTGIDVRAGCRFGSDPLDVSFQLLELGFQYVVIIQSPGVSGDTAATWPFVRPMAAVVIHSDGDDGPAPGENAGGIGPAVRIARHPGHGGMIPPAEPGPELGTQCLRQGLHGGETTDADRVEPKSARLVFNPKRKGRGSHCP